MDSARCVLAGMFGKEGFKGDFESFLLISAILCIDIKFMQLYELILFVLIVQSSIKWAPEKVHHKLFYCL